MSDRGAGFSVTATRQNEPSLANGFCEAAGPAARPAGGVNAPAATVCARVTTPCDTDNEERLSHVAADAAGTKTTHVPAKAMARAARTGFMRRSVALRWYADTVSLTPHLQVSLGRRRAITAGLLLGMSLGALEATVVSTAMPTVIATLGGLAHYS